MARKGIFKGLDNWRDDEPDSSEALGPGKVTGAVKGLSEGLRDFQQNSLQDIDPNLIDPDGPADRLSIDPVELGKLAESIRVHGQQVPIMVRPSPTKGRYLIVFGRRRVEALRMIGQPARAIVKKLTDEESALAQGQENSVRIDLTYIEKGLFALHLQEAGYKDEFIRDALNIDRTTQSRMRTVASAIPLDIIQAIGPATSVGRRPWAELADVVKLSGRASIDEFVGLAEALAGSKDTDERFSIALGFIRNAVSTRAADSVVTSAPSPTRAAGGAESGAVGPDQKTRHKTPRVGEGEVTVTDGAVTVVTPLVADQEFADWLRANLNGVITDLHSQFRKGGTQ